MTDRPDTESDSQLLDPQLLEFARRFDPARHLPDAPPVTAEQLRHRAERREKLDRQWRANPMPRPLRHFWLPAVCVAGILLLSMLGVAVLRPFQSPTLSESHPAPGSPSPLHPSGQARPAPLELPASQGNAGAAKAKLSDLAGQVARQPSPSPAMYTYIRRQVWAAAPDSQAVIAIDIQTWLRADLSATEQSTTLPAQAAGGQTARWTEELPEDLRPTKQAYGPGGYPHPVPAPAAQAGILAGQLGKAYSYRIATGVADLFRLGLTPGQRQAALQVLAGNTNLAFHGEVKDRASRTGIAFTSTDPGTGVREALIFHPDTGELLDYERMVAGPGGETLVDAYTLYLDIRTTNTGP